MKLLLIAYPELSNKDFELIESYRKENDKLFNVIKPHFTFVFPVTDISITDFSTEIKKQLEGIISISFCLRCSTINKDDFRESYHTFLVPDEGFSQILKLHDKLYRDKLFIHQRLDIDFIPHITIGSSTDKLICKKMVDEWNATGFAIHGIISAVDILKYENENVITVEKLKLN